MSDMNVTDEPRDVRAKVTTADRSLGRELYQQPLLTRHKPLLDLTAANKKDDAKAST